MRRGFVLLLLALSTSLFAQTSLKPTSYTMSVLGTSTLHDWESKVDKVTGSMTASSDLSDITDLKVTVPVTAIKGGKDLQDEKTYEAFNYEKHPNITFVLTETKKTSNGMTLVGKLTMNGYVKTIEIPVKKSESNGKVVLSGEKELDMTQWNMKPPSVMMGTIKVGPKVTVKFEVTFS
ncbi:MAG: YceI family protein [Bacteroidota bacterium]|nr:YceI family protein [Bacteroidota bacterium]